MVIVQPHMLKDMGTVRLRTVLTNGGIDGTEDVVSLENLAWTIKDLLPTRFTRNDDLNIHREQSGMSAQSHHQINSYREGDNHHGGNNRTPSCSMETSIECIYIHNDQFFDSERPVSKVDKAQSKAVLKTMRGITQRAEAFVRSMVDPSDGPSNELPVFVVTDVSFWCLRDFGSRLMRTADVQVAAIGTKNNTQQSTQCSTNRACIETIESYPKHKRSLKTLGAAIESYMKRHGFWKVGGSNGQQTYHQEVIFLLYSKPDDRFDMVTLQC